MKKWVELVMVFAVVGCAGTQEKPIMEKTTPVVEKTVNEPVPVAQNEASIDPHVLYLLMSAEIAGQRNQFGVALDAYLQAAKLVNDPRIAERATKIGLFLKDNKRAEEAARLWLQEDPNNLTARKIALLAALRVNNKSEAVAQLNQSLQMDPAGFEMTLLEMSKLMEKGGKDQFMLDVLDELATQHPQQAAIFFVQSLLAAKLQKNELARQKINTALRLEPDWSKALIFRAQLAKHNGHLKAAADDLEKVLQQSPEDKRVRKMLAQIYILSKNYDQAINLYRQLLKEKPQDGESQFAIGLIQLQEKHLQAAEKSFKALLHNADWEARASFYLGRIEFKKENYKQALHWLDKVTEGPYAFDAAMSAVSVLINQQHYQQALDRINQLKIRYPRQRLRLLLVKAEIYNSAKKFTSSFDVLTEALRRYPNNRDVLYSRALVAEQIDKLEVVEADLKKILSKHPDDAAALNALGYTLVDRTRRYHEAEKYLERALSLQPDDAVIIDSYGWLQYKLGHMQKALQYLQQAYDQQPENEITAHFVEVLWKTGNKLKAQQLFKKAFDASQQDQYLLDLKKQFPLLKE